MQCPNNPMQFTMQWRRSLWDRGNMSPQYLLWGTCLWMSPQYLGVFVLETSIFSRHLIARSPSVCSNKRRLTAAAVFFFWETVRWTAMGRSLRRLKTWLRNTMTQQRLNSVIVCHVHQDILDATDISAVAADFASRTDIRRSIFRNGPFWKQMYVCDRLIESK